MDECGTTWLFVNTRYEGNVLRANPLSKTESSFHMSFRWMLVIGEAAFVPYTYYKATEQWILSGVVTDWYREQPPYVNIIYMRDPGVWLYGNDKEIV